jgi:archaemetzincin
VHELGHTFNLLHCADGRCVMASSTYVEQIDLKGERFCDRCLDALRAHPVAARGRG